MINEDIFKKIIKTIKDMQKGTIFTFGRLLEENGINDFQTKFEMTDKLKTELKTKIETYEEDKGQFLGANFVFRFIRK